MFVWPWIPDINIIRLHNLFIQVLIRTLLSGSYFLSTSIPSISMLFFYLHTNFFDDIYFDYYWDWIKMVMAEKYRSNHIRYWHYQNYTIWAKEKIELKRYTLRQIHVWFCLFALTPFEIFLTTICYCDDLCEE